MLFERQQYQIDCVDNIVAVLNRCDVRSNDFDNLQTAISKLWEEKGYHQFQKTDKKRLDVLMETGTGKTFTYLKSIFELNKQFDKKKFIIVVPRTAIKLGVVQNIKLTADYFFNQYGEHLKYIDYPRDGLSKVEHDFLNTQDLCVLITNNSAFNSEKNNINKKKENLFEHDSTWQAIKAENPIIIIDEPHLLKGTETQKGLDKLHTSLQIRFGATFPTDKKDKEHHLSNVVYRLDSISAFRAYLVKGICVHTLISDSEQGGLKLLSTESRPKTFTVVYDINQVVNKKSIKLGEDIGAATRLAAYNGITATKITKNKVSLSNRTTLNLSKGGYALGEEEMRQMVSVAIDKHFEKEERLFKQGIKTLSLFFIPQVDDFRAGEHNPKPRIKQIFEEAYWEKRAKVLETTNHETYKNYLAKDFSEEGKLQVHEGYFSGDKGTKDKKEADGVNLILNEKEKLLSLDTPLRFIFSVWALQEGWDNPNIFTICKLADTAKDTSRRQQVGRGLRIAINQKGSRLTYKKLAEKEHDFYDINTLDMVVSGKEKEFIQNIQQEVQQASYSLVGDTLTLEALNNLGLNDTESAELFVLLRKNQIINAAGEIQSSMAEFLKDQRKIAPLNLSESRYQEFLDIFKDNQHISVRDGNKPQKKVSVRKTKWRAFKDIWETINKKAKIVYRDIEEASLIKTVAKNFNAEHIEPLRTKIHTQRYNPQIDAIENREEIQMGAVDFFETQKFSDFLHFFVKEEKFPFAFMVKLLNEIETQKIKNNPSKAKERLLTILKDVIHGTIVSHVSYKFLDTSIYPNSLQSENGWGKSPIPHTLLGQYFLERERAPNHLLYNTVCYDSEIEKEIQAQDPSNVNDSKITVFAKLPKISIPTPYKTYNPDFAYLIEKQGGKKLFLVVEAKGYASEKDISRDEKQKIKYARRFFEELQGMLPKVEIQYKIRLKNQDLTQLIPSHK